MPFPKSRYLQPNTLLVAFWCCALVAAQANEPEACRLSSDRDPDYKFRLDHWMRRGICVRTQGSPCSAVLPPVLDGLNKLREAEYAGAASVLSLLPTIGALFGPPTSEIWRLKCIVPFGGWLAMALSFGGALMPVHAEDYDNAVAKDETAIGRQNLRRQIPGPQGATLDIHDRLRELGDRIRERVGRHDSVRLPKQTLLLGLGMMFVLFAMAQSAMGVVEQGAIVNFDCSMRFWMHLWYILVTFAAWAEDRAYRPFKRTYKLYVSSLPYEVDILGGQSIKDRFSTNAAFANALTNLGTMKPAELHILGSHLRTNAGNSIMVLVSIVGAQKLAPWYQRLSRVFSVGVFVTGTAFFASVTLLSLIMAVVVLTLSLAAGIFGRAIASWIVSRVADVEPVIHFISSAEDEAYRAISEILSLRMDDGSSLQVEIRGQILIDGKRVASRSKYIVAILGVLADPYDIAKQFRKNVHPAGSGVAMSMMSAQQMNASRSSGATTPFLVPGAAPSLPFHRADSGVVPVAGHQNASSMISSRGSEANSFQIARRPVSNADLEG